MACKGLCNKIYGERRQNYYRATKVSKKCGSCLFAVEAQEPVCKCCGRKFRIALRRRKKHLPTPRTTTRLFVVDVNVKLV